MVPKLAYRLLAVCALALLPVGGSLAAGDNYFPKNPFDARFCAGLATSFRSENAARLECTSPTTAIVVEYYDYWPEAIGQSLAFAAQTGRQPGIALVCRNDHAHCEIAAHAVRQALARYAVPVTLWDCALTDATLAECTELK